METWQFGIVHFEAAFGHEGLIFSQEIPKWLTKNFKVVHNIITQGTSF